jgi:Ser/Thr protein kinase RdoA (MazF antagonist)
MPGNTHLQVQNTKMCESAGRLAGRFHRALHKKEYTFCHRRLGVHDTGAHLKKLEKAFQEHRGHRCFQEVSKLTLKSKIKKIIANKLGVKLGFDL